MALLKEIATPYGPSVKANYHHICEVHWVKSGTTTVQLAGHASKEDRLAAGTVALGRINVQLAPLDELPPLAGLYALIKALPEWAGAQDA
jgi:hypothetical protein